ncbi:hypothetical protein GH733_010272 [Mirounga leonina]|nr:hypothetical protein GH733_010272 [Mirounga leonina]
MGFGSSECYSSLLFRPFSFLFCVPGNILEPPPCRSDPGNCTQFCTLQEDCQNGLQCCSSFCGIVCTLNDNINHDRSTHQNVCSPQSCSLSSAEQFPSTDHDCSGGPGVGWEAWMEQGIALESSPSLRDNMIKPHDEGSDNLTMILIPLSLQQLWKMLLPPANPL